MGFTLYLLVVTCTGNVGVCTSIKTASDFKTKESCQETFARVLEMAEKTEIPRVDGFCQKTDSVVKDVYMNQGNPKT